MGLTYSVLERDRTKNDKNYNSCVSLYHNRARQKSYIDR